MRWFPNIAQDLGHMLIATTGELGELANIVKKVDRGSLELTPEVRHDIAMEMTDVFIYICNMAMIMGVDLAAAYHIKRAENEARFAHPTSSHYTDHLDPADGEDNDSES